MLLGKVKLCLPSEENSFKSVIIRYFFGLSLPLLVQFLEDVIESDSNFNLRSISALSFDKLLTGNGEQLFNST